ncbi:hypothetical protein T10_10884 [Trichinella papuae]|uniref:Uncharacterized protein n=1 Tax=Trichinella papuae TaxID=268474 RepID=A0A0V1MNJ0_9BILA|nr:hypothetical protein T10_10884 [Trichinella papuae]
MCEYDFYGLWEIVNSVKDFHFNVTFKNDVTVLLPEDEIETFVFELHLSNLCMRLRYRPLAAYCNITDSVKLKTNSTLTASLIVIRSLL